MAIKISKDTLAMCADGDRIQGILLEQKGKAVVPAVAFSAEYPADLADAEKVKILKQLWKTHKIKTKKVSLIIPRHFIAVKVIKLPVAPLPMLGKIIKTNIPQYLPFSVDEINWDWQLLYQDSQNSTILITAIRKDELAKRIAVFKDAGLKLANVDVSSLTLFNTVKYFYKGFEEGTIMFVDVHEGWTDTLITENGRFELSRGIPGISFTKDFSNWKQAVIHTIEAFEKNNPDKKIREVVVLSSQAANKQIDEAHLTSEFKKTTKFFYPSFSGKVTASDDNYAMLMGFSLKALGLAEYSVSLLFSVKEKYTEKSAIVSKTNIGKFLAAAVAVLIIAATIMLSAMNSKYTKEWADWTAKLSIIKNQSVSGIDAYGAISHICRINTSDVRLINFTISTSSVTIKGRAVSEESVYSFKDKIAEVKSKEKETIYFNKIYSQMGFNIRPVSQDGKYDFSLEKRVSIR